MPVLQWLEEDSSRSATIVRKGKRGGSRVDVTYLAFGTSDDTEVHDYANAFFSTNSTYAVGDYTLLIDTYSWNTWGTRRTASKLPTRRAARKTTCRKTR